MSDERPGALLRVVDAWRALTAEGRMAAFAALGLFLTMLLPWYQQNGFSGPHSQPSSNDLNAFAVFSFVEAAVLLVAVGVLALLFARAERHTFHLPGGDGTVIMGAGLWAALLLVWRLFDKPGITGRGVAANVGIQWGIFFALAAAGALAYAGGRMRRATQRREPPLVAHRERRHPPAWREPSEPVPEPPREPPAPGTTVTRVLPPERPRARRPSVPEDQLTMPLGGEPPAGDDD
ncbi:MAG TPA: hypothetical protein VE972_09185 [Conexibacter sp.]|nr:hypothetical protein [Conexibacter sp.]